MLKNLTIMSLIGVLAITLLEVKQLKAELEAQQQENILERVVTIEDLEPLEFEEFEPGEDTVYMSGECNNNMC